MTPRPRHPVRLGALLVALAACGLDVVGGAVDAPIEAGAPDADGGPLPEDASPLDGGVADADARAVLPDAAPVRCSTGERAALGRCYRLVATTQSQSDAKRVCADGGAHLVTIETAAESDFVFDAGSSVSRWIGLEATANSDNKRSNFRWLTGAATSFELWYPNDPNDSALCVVLLPNDPHWADRPCDQLHAAMCERDASGP